MFEIPTILSRILLIDLTAHRPIQTPQLQNPIFSFHQPIRITDRQIVQLPYPPLLTTTIPMHIFILRHQKRIITVIEMQMLL